MGARVSAHESDFILFDEAQDSDGVMMWLLGRPPHAQIV